MSYFAGQNRVDKIPDMTKTLLLIYRQASTFPGN